VDVKLYKKPVCCSGFERLGMDKDIELKKIDILESEFQEWFNMRSSLWVGGIIGFLLLILTVYYNKQFSSDPAQNAIIALVLAVAVSLVLGYYGTRYMSRKSNEFSVYIDDLIGKIEKGESLGLIAELSWQKKKG
jgi:uncharacterized protein YacL